MDKDLIVAQATAPGRSGVAIIRMSGEKCLDLAQRLFLKPKDFFVARQATFVNCYNDEKNLIDEGLCLYFKAPHSFTGEDVIEFQCHGSPIVVDLVLQQAKKYGARQARPGEFSERAFLNDKIDLTQAEAIADLIDSQSKEAASNAIKSLKGKFSEKVHELQSRLTDIRCYLEATIDFPDEEGVDFINESDCAEKLDSAIDTLEDCIRSARQSIIFQKGLKTVLAGEPNVGKSSLLNALANKDRAIVTDIAGTTRDILAENIQINGLPLEIVDTAGIRESEDLVEKEGVRRALEAITEADLVLYVLEAGDNNSDLEEAIAHQEAWKNLQERLPEAFIQEKVIIVLNKIDRKQENGFKKNVGISGQTFTLVALSAKYAKGLDLLAEAIFTRLGLKNQNENTFSARTRHIDALEKTREHLSFAKGLLGEMTGIELVAEELRLAQQNLGEITGEFRADDLLGKIFSSFCIGK